MAASTTQIWCCLFLPAANRGRAVSVRFELHHWALSHTPSQSCLPVCCCCCCCCLLLLQWRIVGYVWGGRTGPLGATMCSSSEPACVFFFFFLPHAHNAVQWRGKRAGWAACLVFGGVALHLCSCWELVMKRRLQHHTHTHTHTPLPIIASHPPTSAANGLSWCHAAGKWSYISPAGCAAALQRAAAYKTVNNWRHCFRGMHQLALGLRGRRRRRRRRRRRGWFIMCWCRTEWDFGMEAQGEGERIGQSNRAKIPHWHGRWLSGASASSFLGDLLAKCGRTDGRKHFLSPAGLMTHCLAKKKKKASHWLIYTKNATFQISLGFPCEVAHQEPENRKWWVEEDF